MFIIATLSFNICRQSWRPAIKLKLTYTAPKTDIKRHFPLVVGLRADVNDVVTLRVKFYIQSNFQLGSHLVSDLLSSATSFLIPKSNHSNWNLL